jgi:hypothetical protein
MNKIIITALVLIGFSISVKAQENESNPFSFSGYLEIYYSYDFGEPDNHIRPSFFYNYNRHNEVNLNLGMVKVNYTKNIVRGNFALMAGTYAQYNMVNEPKMLQYVYEANVGVKVSEKQNLWVDAGIMPSHIGFESAIGKESMALSRSLVAENSPYYEAGVKLGYTSPSEKWYLSAMYLNGWQRIQKTEGNQTPSFGTQAIYKPTAKATWNWSTYIGNEQPDDNKKWRYFSDFYGQFTLSEKSGFVSGFDIGLQQKEKGSSSYDVWYGLVGIFQYKPTSKIQLAVRGEYYLDENEVIIETGTPNGFDTVGFSANFDYLPRPNVIFRLEGRTLNSKDEQFLNNNLPTDSNTFLTTSLAVSF